MFLINENAPAFQGDYLEGEDIIKIEIFEVLPSPSLQAEVRIKRE